MSKNKGMKAISQFVGLLLCMVLIQSAFAAENQNQFTMNFINNSTSENATIEGPIGENATIEDPIIEDAVPNFIDPSYYLHIFNCGIQHRVHCELY